DALETLMKGRTTLVIAHRLSTIRNADRIIVLVNGEIREEGTHEALLARQGEYCRLHNMQFRDNGRGHGEQAANGP
ncbi:MAG: ABC transporter permease, partial [Proteobacteria bacterium]|nr:ABC transporter permease [Pseudomonadota bacterium]